VTGDTIDISGGCLCEAVRYRLRAKLNDTGYCHCRICQRASGAPVMAFGTVPLAAIELVGRSQPRRRRSSDIAERWYCGDCGTPLAIHADYQPDTIDIALATLDDPSAFMPSFHIWTESRISWFDTADDCPRHARFRPNTTGGPKEATARTDEPLQR